jgi:hypothetical protein
MQCATDDKNGQSQCKNSLNWRIDHEVHLQPSRLSANSIHDAALVGASAGLTNVL